MQKHIEQFKNFMKESKDKSFTVEKLLLDFKDTSEDKNLSIFPD